MSGQQGVKSATVVNYNPTYIPNYTISNSSLTVTKTPLNGAITYGCLVTDLSSGNIQANTFITSSTQYGKIGSYTLSKTTDVSNVTICTVPNRVSIMGYIIGNSFYVLTEKPSPMVIFPFMYVTSSDPNITVTPYTYITTWNNTNPGSNYTTYGKNGVYLINNTQMVGSTSSPYTSFTCSFQPSKFIAQIDASVNITGGGTSTLFTGSVINITQGNAYQPNTNDVNACPFLGMTLSGQAITKNGVPLSNIKIVDIQTGAANPFYDVNLPNYPSTIGSYIVSSVLDVSGCKFKGSINPISPSTTSNILTVTQISSGIIMNGHYLSGSNGNAVTTPAPTIISFKQDGSYTFGCSGCSGGTNGNFSTTSGAPAGYNVDGSGNSIPIDTSFINSVPQNFYTYVSGSVTTKPGTTTPIPEKTYWITGKSQISTTSYSLNKAIPSGVGSSITITIATTPTGKSGGIGQYTLSSNQPFIALPTNTNYFVTGPIINGEFAQ